MIVIKWRQVCRINEKLRFERSTTMLQQCGDDLEINKGGKEE